MGWKTGYILAEQYDAPAGRRIITRYGVEQCCFTGAICTYDGPTLAVGNLQRDIRYRHQGAEAAPHCLKTETTGRRCSVTSYYFHVLRSYFNLRARRIVTTHWTKLHELSTVHSKGLRYVGYGQKHLRPDTAAF